MDQPTFADPRSWPRAGSGISEQEAQDPPGNVPGADGRIDSLAVAGGAHPPLFPQGRKCVTAPPAVRHAESPLPPAFLQPERPGHGGPALRVGPGAAVRGTEALRRPARRDHHPEFPSSPGETQIGQGLLSEINTHLESQGLKLREGTIVDATIIGAPSSTKNRTGEREPEMHQTREANQWFFGMKAHILRQAQDGGLRYGHNAQSDTGIMHNMSATAANAHETHTM